MFLQKVTTRQFLTALGGAGQRAPVRTSILVLLQLNLGKWVTKADVIEYVYGGCWQCQNDPKNVIRQSIYKLRKQGWQIESSRAWGNRLISAQKNSSNRGLVRAI